MPTWQNRTNKLGLDMNIYQSLSRWFQKSEAVDLTKEKSGADLILGRRNPIHRPAQCFLERLF